MADRRTGRCPHAKDPSVVLRSGRGFHLGEKFHWHKETRWERATRVPCLIHSPGQTEGVRQSNCVSLEDLAPTILAARRVVSDHPMDGFNLLPLLKNPALARDPPVLTTLDEIHHAVRTNRWRRIRYATG